MSRSNNPPRSQGFTLLEVLIAMAILVIGVSAMAALAATMLTRGRQSRYMNIAETLASEKLEDLNHWNMMAPQICLPTGATSEGSLSAPTTTPISCDGVTGSVEVNYYDDVSIDFSNGGGCPNPSNGCFAESVASVSANGTAYYTTTHSPSGLIPGNPDGTSNAVKTTTAPTNMTFHRSWLIEANPPVNGTAVAGTRRITVLVTLTDQSVQPPVSLQMSLVRQ
jgi:prepilin-type N-terminal cleavage/methylation domain-containing protein